MGVTQDKVEKIRRFSERADKIEKEYQKDPLNASDINSYNRKLDNTLRDLQEHVKRQEEALRKVHK